MTKIIIADDFQTVRDGLKTFINKKNGFNLVLEAKNGQEVIDYLSIDTPDIILMDITMPTLDGLKALEIIATNFPSIKVLIFSMHSNPVYIKESYQKGASGFLLKDTDKSEIQLAIQKIMNGEKYFGGAAANTILYHINKTDYRKKAIETLTKRELEILQLFKKGLSNEEIAQLLFLSKRTIDTHKTNIKTKLNISSSLALVAYTHEIDL